MLAVGPRKRGCSARLVLLVEAFAPRARQLGYVLGVRALVPCPTAPATTYVRPADHPGAPARRSRRGPGWSDPS
jgi:hypothetical protein